MSSAHNRWLATNGATFVVLFVVAIILLGDLLGSVGDPDRQFVSHFADGTNRAKDIAGAYLLVGAALAFALFLSHVYALLRSGGDEGSLPFASFAGGLVLVGLLIAGAAALSAVPMSIAFAELFREEAHEFGADASRLATQLGFMAIVFAMAAGALAAGAASLSALRTRALPRWTVWTGLVCGAGLLFAAFFLPVVFLAVWVLAVGAASLRRAPPAAARLPPAPSGPPAP